jgi:hypothetical protein
MRYLTGGEPTEPEVVRDRDLPSILAGYEKWGADFGLSVPTRRTAVRCEIAKEQWEQR